MKGTILHVFKDYFPPTRGGVEQHVHDLVHSLEGFRFSVLTSSRSRHETTEEEDGVPVVRLAEYGRPLSTPITPGWAAAMRLLRPSLVHAHMPWPFAELAFLAARSPVPMIASYHADIMRGTGAGWLFRPFQQAFLRRAARILASSPRLLETSPTLSAHRHRVLVVPYGVEPAEWSERPAGADGIRRLHPGPLVLFLGRLVRYKRVDLLVEAMRSLEATLLVVGDGPERPKLERMAGRHGLESKLVFVGEVHDSERAAYYHAADVFVLPSANRAEAFSIAMLEAMACGTPVVCAELGTGTSWLNVDRETGLVVPPGDSRRLAEAARVLLEDNQARLAMGTAAAERVHSRFRKDAMLEALGALYRELCG